MDRDPTAFLREKYEELVENGFNWELRTLEGPSTPVCTVDGEDMIMLCSNNYLNLSNHVKLRQAAKDAIDTHGAGSGSVRAIAGNMDIHIKVEKRLAKFKGTESSLVYQTGFAANSGLIPQLVGKGDIIISDELNHGSIIDGVRLTKADRAIYNHCDMGSLEEVLKKADKNGYRRILVITDGVFSGLRRGRTGAEGTIRTAAFLRRVCPGVFSPCSLLFLSADTTGRKPAVLLGREHGERLPQRLGYPFQDSPACLLLFGPSMLLDCLSRRFLDRLQCGQ